MGADYPADPEKISHKELNSLLDFSPKTVYYGGFMLRGGEVFAGPIVVVDGSLDLQNDAVLQGDAWVINGRLILTGSSRIEGSAIMVNSEEFLSGGAVIGGTVRRYVCECRLDDEIFESEGIVRFLEHEDPKAVKTKFAVMSGQTSRVDYSPLMIGIKRENELRNDPYVRGYAWLGYSMIEKTTGRIGLDALLSIPVGDGRFRFTACGFKRTFTNDNWMMSDLESGLVVMVSGDDYFDYWEKQGGSLGIEYSAAPNVILEGTLSFQKESSLDARSISSIFGSEAKYRPNPAIDDGERLALEGSIVYDGREEEAWMENAWRLSLWAEKGIADGPGDFSYLAFELDVRRYNSLPFGMRFDISGRLFSSFDPIPAQLTRSLNGYGGIRGLSDFPFDPPRGDRLALVRLELRKSLPELPVFKILFTRWALMVFADTGLLRVAENGRAPLDFLGGSLDEWKKSVGIGICGESFVPYVGFYAAQDLDGDDFAPRFILRFERSF